MTPSPTSGTDLAGATVAEVVLVGTAGVFPSQWGGTVRPGTGEVVLTTGAPINSAPPAVTRYALADGRPAAAGVPVEASTPCSTTRSAAALVVPVLPPDGAVVAVDVAGGAPSNVTVAAPQLGARCLVWATQALDGPARGGGLVGTNQDGWTWWWRELLAGALLVPLALVGLARLWRLPRRERPAGAEATPDWYA